METNTLQTPVLFLIFNRPETTERVFQQIRAVRPQRLFVSADGPRLQKPKEEQKCEETRRIIEKVDWPCEVKTNFSRINLGCKRAVSSGIDWFFHQVEDGIILEDDCLPDPSFFYFCQSMLAHYRDDTRIMHIGGANFQDGIIRGSGSYYYSSLNHVWGWATWRRAWELYDVDMKSYPQFIQEEKLQQLFFYQPLRKYWKKNFDLVYEHKKDTWDFQWQYATSFHRGLAIIPNKNLISNIGFDQQATHTVDLFHSMAKKPIEEIKNILHPTLIRIDDAADSYTLKKYLSPPKWKKLFYLMLRYMRA